MPWSASPNGHYLACVGNPDHDTYQKKYTGLRKIGGQEFDIMSQRETTELAPITDHETALAAVRQSIAIGQFSGQQTEIQIQNIARLALVYQLDPMMEEIIPMYGKPYITIKGRRRLDNNAGNRFGLAWKIPDRDFLVHYQDLGAIDKGDVVAVAVGTYLDAPDSPVEVWARCKVHEVAGNDVHLPINAWKLEMAQKRAERKLREVMFGPIPKPKGLEHIEVLQEGDELGDESTTVEGAARLVPEEATKSPLPEYGQCPVHAGVEFKTTENSWGGVNVWHFIGDPKNKDYCRLSVILKGRFGEVWGKTHDDRAEGPINEWLKERYNGRTWSKMDPEQMHDAIRAHTFARLTNGQ